jgi:hypothetical protein
MLRRFLATAALSAVAVVTLWAAPASASKAPPCSWAPNRNPQCAGQTITKFFSKTATNVAFSYKGRLVLCSSRWSYTCRWG